MKWMLVSAAAAQGFDQSLDGLVRQRVITSQERKLLQGGGSAVPMERSRFEKACRTGALSRQDCAFGVARRPPGVPASARVRLHFELRSPSRAGRPSHPCQEASNPAAADRIAQSRLRRESLLRIRTDAGVPLICDFSTDQLLNARVILHDCNTKSLGGSPPLAQGN